MRAWEAAAQELREGTPMSPDTETELDRSKDAEDSGEGSGRGAVAAEDLRAHHLPADFGDLVEGLGEVAFHAFVVAGGHVLYIIKLSGTSCGLV